MFGFYRRKKKKILEDKLNEMLPAEVRGGISEKFQKTLDYLRQVFENHDLINFRELQAGKDGALKVCLVSCDGLVDADIIDNYLIRPLVETEAHIPQNSTSDVFLSEVFQVLSVTKTTEYDEIIEGITGGDTLVLIDGLCQALLFDTKGFETRAIDEPDGEKILSGPREGFTESLLKNIAMVQRKLKTERLKMRYYKLGRETKTKLCIAYLDGIVRPSILEELYRRLKDIDIDGILDANYINELIRDDKWSPFRSMGYTERPDIITAKLLEGRVALFVDGTPVVLTLPYLFIENFQSNEDYYLNFYFTSFSRFLRIIGFFLTIFLPGVYIAIVAYHQEMLPSSLLISIAIERSAVPLPAALEGIIMLIVFEILRETAVRMQANVSQALSIVGALVVGQAAVEAKLVAAPMLIVVAMAGITSLLIPKMNASILWLRFGILLLASCFGFLGITIACVFLLAHVLDLHSFGVWQFESFENMHYQSFKDTAFRAPWPQMLLRPQSLTRNVRRQKHRPEELK
jgi:spore germination protein KA